MLPPHCITDTCTVSKPQQFSIIGGLSLIRTACLAIATAAIEPHTELVKVVEETRQTTTEPEASSVDIHQREPTDPTPASYPYDNNDAHLRPETASPGNEDGSTSQCGLSDDGGNLCSWRDMAAMALICYNVLSFVLLFGAWMRGWLDNGLGVRTDLIREDMGRLAHNPNLPVNSILLYLL